ncbi:MAG: helix-turn-helix domain-containing protein [Acidobacteriaceae bacterium]|nr:helix-turn-helix domain-containing protein [Acidobacteriaceae bacterium]
MKFLDAKQASEFLGGINFRTLYRWARNKQIPAYALNEGKRILWRFTEEDLTEWMLSKLNISVNFASSVTSVP